MPSLESYFQAHGKSFDAYSHWLGEATAEELLAGGVGPGMLIELYGRGNENLSRYMSMSDNYLRNHGFTLESSESRSSKYCLDRNKTIFISLCGELAVSLMIHSNDPRENDINSTKDISQIVMGLLSFVQQEKISTGLLPSAASDYNYEIKNYIFDPKGFRIFQM